MNPKGSQIVAPYGLWKSANDIEQHISQASAPSYPFRYKGQCYWLESRPNEGGRVSLMKQFGGGDSQSLLPCEYNIRTSVHEYGGQCFCHVGKDIIFNNYRDGVLYKQSLSPNASPIAVSNSNSENAQSSFADLICTPNCRFVIAVEEVVKDFNENENQIVAINLHSGKHTILAKGSDFYANPVVCKDGLQLAWIEWSHPFMPWDQSRIVLAELSYEDDEISIISRRTIVDEPNRSVCQLGFLDDHRLVFISDSNDCDFWSFFVLHDGLIKQISDCLGEFGEAHWVFGQKRWQSVGDGILIAVLTTNNGDELVEVDCISGDITTLHQGFAACSQLQYNGDEVLFVAHYTDRTAELKSLKLQSGAVESIFDKPLEVNQELYSQPITVEFPTDNGDTAHGLFYPPCNKDYTAAKGSLPPLIVTIHGGPTGRAGLELHHIKQYFCSLGFALFDINHRGSTGYGRQYRQSLIGQWGEFDASDIRNGIRYLINNNWIDGEQVFIRGSSAGGYAVLRALTQFPELFAAGACYYGIGNLITLCKITHKFESRYTDRLVGQNFDIRTAEEPDSVFVQRSPIFQMHELACPLILFQGEDDKVVPPEVSREVVNLLKRKGIKHSYTEYPGEGHGFRQSSSKIDSLTKEIEFFSDIIKDQLQQT